MTSDVKENIAIGMEIPSIKKPPIDRTTLALFAGASNDHNPMHIDIDFAKKAGMPDVFAHGMLSMAYLAQVVTSWVPQKAIKSYRTRFGAITHLGDQITCGGKVAELFQKDGERFAKVQLAALDQNGEAKLTGEAVVSLDAAGL